MADFPFNRWHLPVIGTNSVDVPRILGGANAFGSGAWPSANLAIYVPFTLRVPYLVRKLWWGNGSTANGNVDCGIYSVGGTLITSAGSTAQSGTDAIQSVDITDILLQPGSYYMGLALSSGTGTIYRQLNGVNPLIVMGCAQEASALPLPATMTPATVANDYYPLFGITNRTLI